MVGSRQKNHNAQRHKIVEVAKGTIRSVFFRRGAGRCNFSFGGYGESVEFVKKHLYKFRKVQVKVVPYKFFSIRKLKRERWCGHSHGLQF